ncbi:MAG TPA: hypothetical protein VLM43_04965, partial [Desulfobacterales bacterium]|nr:hypothetical protein [Desulfobacterales bacterium]
PISKCDFFLMRKATQGFSLWRTKSTPQTETRGEHSTSEKGPFINGKQRREYERRIYSPIHQNTRL